MSDLHSPVRELFRFASMKVALHLQFRSTNYRVSDGKVFFFNLDVDVLIIRTNFQKCRRMAATASNRKGAKIEK